MAGPHVAGIVALMRSANPDIEVAAVKQILMSTARDQDGLGDDNDSGWGMVDAHAAVSAALRLVGVHDAEASDFSPPGLRPIRPNPFRPSEGPVVLRYRLASPGVARLQVLDVGGRLLRTLSEEAQAPGDHSVR